MSRRSFWDGYWIQEVWRYLSQPPNMRNGHQNLASLPKVKVEAILGSLNHIANVYPPMRHFLGKIYQALYRTNSSGGWTSLRAPEKADLHMLMLFLDSAKKGLSMNNLTYRKPTHIHQSDVQRNYRSCLPVDCHLWSSLNSLEFLACLINIWNDIFHYVITHESCLLS